MFNLEDLLCKQPWFLCFRSNEIKFLIDIMQKYGFTNLKENNYEEYYY